MWIQQVSCKDNIDNIVNNYNILPLTAHILINRGLNDIKKIHEFLYPQYIQLPDIFNTSVNIIVNAIKNKDIIFIHGDYDADGITATAILTKTIKKLGGNVYYFIPARNHGYGLKDYGVDLAIKHKASILLTVDCGINSYQEVQNAILNGLKVVILDHHKIFTLAQTPYIISGQLLKQDDYHFHLSGAGLAYMCAIAIAKKFGLDDEIKYSILDLASLGTIADMVPVLGINRWIIKEGIEIIKNNPSVGIQAIIETGRLSADNITSQNIPFTLTPRINAAGRMANANLSFDLLMAEDKNSALQLASQIENLNFQRQNQQNKYLNIAEQDIKQHDTASIIIKGQYPIGIIGLIAGKLCEKYAVPAIVFTEKDNMLIGSGRSIEGIDIYKMLKKCSRLINTFGGHELAVGLNISAEKFYDFVQAFDEEYKQEMQKNKIKCPSIVAIDAKVSIPDINIRLINEIKTLEPFGIGNCFPMLYFQKCYISNITSIGSNGNHIKFVVSQNNQKIDAIGWNMYNSKLLSNVNEEHDIIFIPEINQWNNKSNIRINVQNIKLSKENIIIEQQN